MQINAFETAKNQLNQIAETINKCLQAVDNFENNLPTMTENSFVNNLCFVTDLAEKTALNLRKLPLDLGVPADAFDVTKTIKEAFDFSAGFTERGWFFMKIPPLVKKQSYRHYSYIGDSVYRLLYNYFNADCKISPPKYEDCDIVFVNVLSKDSKLFKIRDNDNLEYNSVTNVLATYFLPDDNPLFCNQYHASIIGESNYTAVFLIPHKDFSLFIYNFDNGIIEYESTPFLMPENQ